MPQHLARRVLAGLAVLACVALGVSIWRFNAAREAGPPISGETRDGFVKSAVDGCVALQKASPDNAEVPAATVTAYCACYADALASRFTAKDLERLRGRPSSEIQAEMRPRMAESEQACLAKLGVRK